MIQQKVPETKDELWEAYWQTGDIKYRNQLALEYTHIVKFYVYQLRGVYENYADMEDMTNQGIIALLEAVEKYDPQRKTKFETYASIRVQGAIIDYVRNQDWVTTRAKKEAKMVNKATDELMSALERMPTSEEIGAYLNIPAKSVEKIQGEVHVFNWLSYEELVDVGLYGVKGYREQNNTAAEQPGTNVEQDELKRIISESLDELTEKEKLVVTLFYYEELKKKDIAYILGISLSRVCQIHSKALRKMKSKLKKYLYGDEAE